MVRTSHRSKFNVNNMGQYGLFMVDPRLDHPGASPQELPRIVRQVRKLRSSDRYRSLRSRLAS